MNIASTTRSIVPTNLSSLSGYYGCREAIGVHDSIQATCILIDEHFFISFDLVAVDSLLKERIQKKLPNTISLTLFATHTHSAPTGTVDTTGSMSFMENVFGPIDETYLDFIANQVTDAFFELVDRLEPFDCFQSSGTIIDVYRQRIPLNHAIDTSYWILRFQTPSQRISVLSFACHPTILGPENQYISRDLLHGVHTHLESDILFFINGACGDISTRDTRKDASFDEVDRLGKCIVDSIQDPRNVWKAIINPTLEIFSNTFTVSTKTVETMCTSRTGQTNLAFDLQKEIVENRKSPLKLTTKTLVFGTHTLMCFPGELFNCFSSKDYKIGTYADGYYSYFTSKDAFTIPTYEAIISLIPESTCETLMTQIDDSVKETIYGNNELS